MTDYSTAENSGNQPQVNLPNSIAVLILGIIGILTCCCYGGGFIFGIIALILASKDMKRYRANPEMYRSSSYNNLKVGRICAIIGIALSAIFILYAIWMISQIGLENFSDPDTLRQKLEELSQGK